jgi:hypothetical protein
MERWGRSGGPGGASTAQLAGLVVGQRIGSGAQQLAGVGIENISVAASMRS